MKKDELIEIVKEQAHLAQAVEAKDKEIVDLKEKNREVVEDLKGQIKELSKRPKREELDKINKELTDLKTMMKDMKSPEQIKELEEKFEKVAKVADMYITAYRDLLRQQKVSLDIAISHESLMSEQIK